MQAIAMELERKGSIGLSPLGLRQKERERQSHGGGNMIMMIMKKMMMMYLKL